MTGHIPTIVCAPRLIHSPNTDPVQTPGSECARSSAHLRSIIADVASRTAVGGLADCHNVSRCRRRRCDIRTKKLRARSPDNNADAVGSASYHRRRSSLVAAVLNMPSRKSFPSFIQTMLQFIVMHPCLATLRSHRLADVSMHAFFYNDRSRHQ